MKHFSCLTALCVGLLLVSGCSKPDSSSSAVATASTASAVATGLPAPCSLINQTETEIALGKGATMTASHNPRTEMDECHLKSGPGKDMEIIILVHKVENWDMVKKALSGSDKGILGLGDDAFQTRFTGYNVRKGNRYVQVFGVMTNETSANEKATRYLAGRAASRL